ncbi:hypothetical protein V8E36_007697 [Tilletia maclaganii]
MPRQGRSPNARRPLLSDRHHAAGKSIPELQHLGGWESGSALRYIRDIHLRHAKIGANIDVDALRRPLIGALRTRAADTQDRIDIPQHKDARRRRVDAVLCFHITIFSNFFVGTT